MSEQEIYNKRARNSGSTLNRHILYYANLTVSCRMIHYFIRYNLIPKFSNHSQINDTKMQIIYAVKNRLKVNWAYLITHHMISQNKISGGLPYVRLVTKILQYCGIDLKGESRFQMTSKEHEKMLELQIRTWVSLRINMVSTSIVR